MIIIGEKLNGAIKSVAEAIQKRDADFVRNLATRQLDSRSDYLDICSGVHEGDAEVLKWTIDLIQADHPDVKFSLDSPNPDTILECIPFCKNPGLINSVSLEGDKADKIFSAVADKKGWKIVALLLDDTGIPDDVEKRMDNFHRLVKKADEYGIALSRIYFDPMVFTVGTSPDSFLNFIGTAQKIHEEYPDAHIVSLRRADARTRPCSCSPRPLRPRSIYRQKSPDPRRLRRYRQERRRRGSPDR